MYKLLWKVVVGFIENDILYNILSHFLEERWTLKVS